MVHFALIQLTKKHTEIFGTFIEIILKNKWDLTIYYNLNVDEYSFVPYYMYLFEKDITVKPTGYLVEDMEKIDYFIWTSSSDDNRMPEVFKSAEFANKSIFIQHQSAHLKSFMAKNIVVSPVIQINDVLSTYILPVYKNYKKLHYKKPEDGKTIFALIGGIRGTSNGKILDRDLDLIQHILEEYPNENYEFQFFMRKWDWIWISKKRPFLNNNPKIKAFSGLQTPELIKKLKQAKFILPIAKKNGWFYWQRLTGSIPLAINLNIPLLIDKKLATIYGLENCSLIYNDSILEIFKDVINMEDSTYYDYIEKLVKYKKNICKQNQTNFINICLKQTTFTPQPIPYISQENLMNDKSFVKLFNKN